VLQVKQQFNNKLLRMYAAVKEYLNFASQIFSDVLTSITRTAFNEMFLLYLFATSEQLLD